MIRIPKRGLFVTGTENLIFLSSTHNYNDQWVRTMYKKKYINPFLERRFLAHGGESPSSLVPSFKPTAFMPLALPSPVRPLPTNRTFIYIQTTLTCPLVLSGICILNKRKSIAVYSIKVDTQTPHVGLKSTATAVSPKYYNKSSCWAALAISVVLGPLVRLSSQPVFWVPSVTRICHFFF
jgi:hypothetical protein